MNEHALLVLEFKQSLQTIAARAATPMGREHILGLRPKTSPSLVREELSRVSEIHGYLEVDPHWTPPTFPDVRQPLEAIAPAGAVARPEELAAFLHLLASSRILAGQIDLLLPEGSDSADAKAFGSAEKAGKDATRRTTAPDRSEARPREVDVGSVHLRAIRARLPVQRDLEERLSKVVDEEGAVRDDASTQLRAIRNKQRALRGDIVRQLEKYVATLPEAHRVEGASVSVRDGRYVIAIRREGKSQVGGVIRGESATGATLFVEPPLGIRLMNDLHDLEREEAREVHRLLRDATERLQPLSGELQEGFRAQIELDSLRARALAARAWDASAPDVAESGEELRIVGGRHPLLLEQEGEAIPFSLELAPEERVVVVSGPNTGGKTVLLKAVGLIQALAQSGVVPPVRGGTRLPILTEIFADIGDEQSIAQSLSTFSAHVENARQILAEAGPGALVLIDEMGTGTDPSEGAVLARVILEALVESGARAFVTSHLGSLKRLDQAGSGIVNASLRFDTEKLEPTYELQKGRPGRSFGLAIARRLGFPEELLDRAESYLGSGELKLEGLLEALELKERELSEALTEARLAGEEARRRRADAEAREARLEDRERSLEAESRERARDLLLEARQEVEAAIRELRVSERRGVEEAATKARRRVEAAARAQRDLSPRGLTRRKRRDARPVASGERARIVASGTVGVVRETRDDRVTLEVGGVKLQVPREEIEPLGEHVPAEVERDATPSIAGWTELDLPASHEVDLRGLRVEEVDLKLGRALDAAVVRGLSEIRIIHGLGTGAVKARVREILSSDERIESSRPGGRGEGGAGVTVAVLR